MGGCKCNDDTAVWGPGQGKHAEKWACYCNALDQYASMEEFKYIDEDGNPTQEEYADEATKIKNKINDKNRKLCGVISSCQTAAVV